MLINHVDFRIESYGHSLRESTRRTQVKNVLFASGIDFIRGKEIINLQIAFTYGRYSELDRIDFNALSSRAALDELSQIVEDCNFSDSAVSVNNAVRIPEAPLLLRNTLDKRY